MKMKSKPQMKHHNHTPRIMTQTSQQHFNPSTQQTLTRIRTRTPGVRTQPVTTPPSANPANVATSSSSPPPDREAPPSSKCSTTSPLSAYQGKTATSSTPLRYSKAISERILMYWNRISIGRRGHIFITLSHRRE